MYQGQNQQRQPRKPCTGRVWPGKRASDKAPHFTGEIALPDGHTMRVALWEEYKNGQFNGFSLKLSEDTRQQGNGYQAQGQQGQPQGYGQQSGGYAPQNGYSASQGGGYAPQPQNTSQRPFAPPSAYSEGDQGYVPGFDD